MDQTNALSWINLKINSNHEIPTQKWKRNSFLPHQDFNLGPLQPETIVLPLSSSQQLLLIFGHIKIGKVS